MSPAPLVGNRSSKAAQHPAAQPGQRAPVQGIPFTRASRIKSSLAFDTGAVQLGAATVIAAPIELVPGGFLKYVELGITLTTAANAAAVTFAADGPFNAVSYMAVTNSAGDSIIVGISAFQLMLLNKYGAFAQNPPFCDPRADRTFSVTTGAVATGGSATFNLRLPLGEICQQDAFCALPNLAANKSYQLMFQYAPSATIYGVAPTAPPQIRIQATMRYWAAPNRQNSAGVPQQAAPDGNGSVSLIRYQTSPVTAGDRIVQFTNVGNVLRLILFTLRTAAGARTQVDWPATFQLILNNDTLFYKTLTDWQSESSEVYGYVNGAIDTALGLDTGVFPIYDFLTQYGMVETNGSRDQYLPTLDATLLQGRFTSFGAAANTLEVITNEIKPVSAAALYNPRLG